MSAADSPGSRSHELTTVERGMRVVIASTLISAVLAAVKIIAGVLGNSYALIADGAESLLDIVSSLVVWGSLKIAARPPDERHPFGHGKAEPLGAMVVAVALLATAVGIAVQSLREISTPQHAPASFTLFVLLGVIATKEILFRKLSSTGASIRSRALQTDAWHHRSDALTSAAAFVGISISLLAGEGYESADDWAALFACAVIVFNGVRLLRSALDEVMDAAPPAGTEESIRKIASGVGNVLQVEKCRVHKSGFSLFVEVHVVVNGDITVRTGHEIAHEVKDALLEAELGVRDVTVHIEPEECARPGVEGPPAALDGGPSTAGAS